jgi:hypothetical protein
MNSTIRPPQWTTFGRPSSTGAFAILAAGQVLAAGGQTFDKNSGTLVPTASAELYTP